MQFSPGALRFSTVPTEPETADPNERFRARRANARKRRRHHRSFALAALAIAAALVALGATVIGTRQHGSRKAGSQAKSTKKAAQPAQPRALPAEMRGVHVTMALASIPGKLDEYLGMPGLKIGRAHV